MPDRFERFSFALLEIYRHWYSIAQREMKALNLSVPHALYLLAMQNYEDGLTATELSEVCSRDKAELSRCISQFEARGLVRRDAVRGNQYRALIKLTDEGKAVAARLRERANTAVALGGRGIDEADRTTFYEVLELIAYNLQTISAEGLPSSEPSEPNTTV